MRLLVSILAVGLLAHFAPLAFAYPADDSIFDESADNQPQPIDLQNPPAKIAFRAPTLAALIALAKPTEVCDRDMVWVSKGGDGQPHFSFCTAQPVELADLKPFWAIIRMPANTVVLDDFETSDELRDLPLVTKQPQSDSGSGNYAMLVAQDTQGDRVFELGSENMWSGTGHMTQERRIYVSGRKDGTWQFIGEGPSETHSRCGADYSTSTSVTSHISFTGNRQAPVTIDFVATQDQDYGNEGESEEPDACPPLESGSDAVLAGPLPAKLRWIGRPYVVVDKTDSLAAIAVRLTHWEVGSGWPDGPSIQKTLVERAVLKSLRDLNPGLSPGALAPRSCVLLLTDAEINNLLSPPSLAWAASKLSPAISQFTEDGLTLINRGGSLSPGLAAAALALLGAITTLFSRGIRFR
jgi:hypothetical protein